MIDQIFSPEEGLQASLWLTAVQEWTDPNWRDRIVWRVPTGHRYRTKTPPSED